MNKEHLSICFCQDGRLDLVNLKSICYILHALFEFGIPQSNFFKNNSHITLRSHLEVNYLVFDVRQEK